MTGVARFRTNVYRDNSTVPPWPCALSRFDIMTLKGLGLPKAIVDLTMLPKGIILCTGPHWLRQEHHAGRHAATMPTCTAATTS